MLLAY
jgi:hypothetical protein